MANIDNIDDASIVREGITYLFDSMVKDINTDPNAVHEAIAMVVRELFAKINKPGEIDVVSEGDIAAFVGFSLTNACRLLTLLSCHTHENKSPRTPGTPRTPRLTRIKGGMKQPPRAASPPPLSRDVISSQPILLKNAIGEGEIQPPPEPNMFNRTLSSVAHGVRTGASIVANLARPPLTAVSLSTEYGINILRVYNKTAFATIAKRLFGQGKIDLDAILYMVMLVMLMVFYYVFLGSYTKRSLSGDLTTAKIELYKNSAKRLLTLRCYATNESSIFDALNVFHNIDSLSTAITTLIAKVNSGDLFGLWRTLWDIKYRHLIEALENSNDVDPVCNTVLGAVYKIAEHAVDAKNNIGSVAYLIESYILSIALNILKYGNGVVLIGLGFPLTFDELAKYMAGFVSKLFNRKSRWLQDESALIIALQHTFKASCDVLLGAASFLSLNQFKKKTPQEAAIEVEGGGRRKTNKRKFKSMSGKARRSRNFRVGRSKRSNIKPKHSRKKN